MAAYRKLELTLISAKDLDDVNVFSKMDVYAVVSIADEPRSTQRTSTDKDGGKSPKWNATLSFYVPVDHAAAARLVLHVVLRSERTLGDRDIGEVRIPLKELLGDLDGKAPASTPQFVSYQVRKPSGKAKGVINISYKFLDPSPAAVPPPSAAYPATAPPPPVAYPTTARPPAGYPSPGTYAKPADPVAAYPAPGSSAGSAYPPPSKDSKVGEPATAYPPPAGYPSPGTNAKPADPVAAYPAPGSSSASAYPPPSKDSKVGEPATAYPAPAPGPSGAYPPPGGYPPYGYTPPPPGYGYPPPQYGYAQPPPGYGYPPPAGYGYGAAPQAPPKKNKFGAGLGAGLLGGAIGGLLIGDLVSDTAAYDSGYDAGFDDAGGFDF